MEHKVLPRSERDPRDTWATGDLFSTDDAWRAAYAQAEEIVRALGGYQGRLGESGPVLLAYLERSDDLSRALSPLVNYAFRRSDEDTRDPVYQEMSARAQNLMVAAGEATAFETPEILAIPEERMDAFYQEAPGLEHYRLALTRIRRQREHTLSPEGEALLASAGKLAQSADDIFGFLNDADLRFPDAADCAGQLHPVTHGSYLALMRSEDRTLRENAFRSLYGAYRQFRNTLAATLSAQMNQLQFFANARRYPSALHASLDRTEVPVEIYHNLIDTVHRHFPTMHRYIRLRKRLLGVEELHHYDLYTPIVAGEDSAVPFEEAKRLALEALRPLGEDYCATVRAAFDSRWIDVYENEGKRSGAYSAGVYGAHPFVLLNYNDTIRSVFTLVHEMGHAMHSHLSNRTQPVTYASYVIFVAEVASTCNEALLMQYLLGGAGSRKRRAYLINYFLEQFRTTLYRQTMFAEFELWCSEQTRAGQVLTAEAMSRKYAALNRAYYGEDLAADEEISLEWSRIPHFYYNFYVYQYATGFACAIALSQRILRGEPGAVEDYLRFLGGGSSADPVSLLRGAGVDIATPQPVEDALALFDRLISELEELTA